MPVLDALREALQSHRYALSIDPDSPDTLFNTAQVLTSIAEELSKDPSSHEQGALQLLEEALELQNRCLSTQELKLEESSAQQRQMQEQFESVSASNPEEIPQSENEPSTESSHQENTEQQWFSIVEPVTESTLIDTIIAQLGTLTTLCNVLGSTTAAVPTTSLAWVEEYSSKLLSTKLPDLAKNVDEAILQEIALAKANFMSALLEAGFRTGNIDAETYKRERDSAFSIAELQLETSFDAAMANAQSLIAYNSALADLSHNNSTSHASSRWHALTSAIATLLTAAKSQSALIDDIPKTHFLRGDCSLLQYQLSRPPISYQAAIKNGPQLLKNAEVFYRNASKLFQDEEQKFIATLRSSVAQALQLEGGLEKMSLSFVGKERDQAWLQGQIMEMVEEGTLHDDLV